MSDKVKLMSSLLNSIFGRYNTEKSNLYERHCVGYEKILNRYMIGGKEVIHKVNKNGEKNNI